MRVCVCVDLCAAGLGFFLWEVEGGGGGSFFWGGGGIVVWGSGWGGGEGWGRGWGVKEVGRGGITKADYVPYRSVQDMVRKGG